MTNSLRVASVRLPHYFVRVLFKSLLILLVASPLLFAQNNISVSFNDGFVGVNINNNSAGPAYRFSTYGWTNVQFSQNSSSNIFVTQGNDIVGNVLITDYDGIEYTIPGFIKWRGPSGTVTTIVFRPSSSTTLKIGPSTTRTITSSDDIGLTFNGSNLVLTDGGTFSGNSAISNVLQSLNDYLGSQPKFSVADLSVNEGAGTATVTVRLNTAASTTTSVGYVLSNGTATAGSDYTTTSGTLTFATGETTKTFTVSIT